MRLRDVCVCVHCTVCFNTTPVSLAPIIIITTIVDGGGGVGVGGTSALSADVLLKTAAYALRETSYATPRSAARRQAENINQLCADRANLNILS